MRIENGEEEILSMMGYHFTSDVLGKKQLAALFRAAVYHVSAHVVSSGIDDYEEWRKGRNPFLATTCIYAFYREEKLYPAKAQKRK